MNINNTIFYLIGKENEVSAVKKHLSLFCFPYVFSDEVFSLKNSEVEKKMISLDNYLMPNVLAVINCSAVDLALAGDVYLKEISNLYTKAHNTWGTYFLTIRQKEYGYVRARITLPDYYA